MGSAARLTRRITERERRLAMTVLAIGHVGLGLWMALSPKSFFDSFAGYGVRNNHYIRDVATFYLALGLIFAAAARRSSWRAPVLAFAALQYGFHLVNHLVDVTNSHPAWVGPVNVLALVLVEAFLLILLRSSRQASP